MTPPPALPSLPGLAWSRHKKPGFSTRVASHASGREVRVALMSYPLYEFETAYNGLTSASAPPAVQSGLGAASLQSLMGFFLQLMGQAGVFLYTDPDDKTAAGQSIGVGDGATQCFVMGRTLGGFNEPVSWVASIANVYLNGVVQPNGNYVLEQPNTLAFYQAPGAGVAITADFNFAFQCRFLDDQMDFEEFMSSLWKLGGMKFRSVKANITPGAPPQWYNLYSIGGALASSVADFSTEGTTNHYYYNGATYANFAAYEAATGLSETRTSSACYTNSAGLLASASSGVIRVGDYNPAALNSKGILLEGASTNIALYSQSMANWSTHNCTVTSGATTGPDGNTSGDKITMTGGSGTLDSYIYDVLALTPSAGTTWTKSGYAKYFDTQWITIRVAIFNGLYVWFDIQNGVVGSHTSGAGFLNASIVSMGNGWYRWSVTYTEDASPNWLMTTASGNGANSAVNGSWYQFGMQQEALPFVSSYIPATTGSASRSTDSLKRTRTSPTSIIKLIKATTPPGVGAEQTLWSADDGTDNNYIRVIYFSDGHIRVLVEAGGSSQANLDMGAVAVNTAFAIALTAAAGNFAASINGGAAVSTSSGSMPTGLVNDRLGSGVDAGYEWFSDIALDAEWTNLAATNAQLLALS